jgi:hypothetical protein
VAGLIELDSVMQAIKWSYSSFYQTLADFFT